MIQSLAAYSEAADIAESRSEPLFRSANRRTSQLTAKPLSSSDAWAMVRRRAKAAGIETAIGCHTFRATGITVYLTNSGTLEKAQQMAAHESAKTTARRTPSRATRWSGLCSGADQFSNQDGHALPRA